MVLKYLFHLYNISVVIQHAVDPAFGRFIVITVKVCKQFPCVHDAVNV